MASGKVLQVHRRQQEKPSAIPNSLRTAVLESVPLQEDLTESKKILIEAWNKQTGTPIQMDIYTACACGEYTFVRSLLEEGIDVNAENKERWTPLMYASFVGHDNVVNHLLEVGKANANHRGAHGRTALMWASANNHESIAYFLLQNGVNKEEADEDGRTSLFLAAMNGHEGTLKLLIDNKANMEAKQKLKGRTPLMMAALNGHENEVEILVKAGASLSTKDSDGKTALDLAKEQARFMLIINFLELSVRKFSGDNGNNTALRSEPRLLIGNMAPRNDTEVILKDPSIKEFLELLKLEKYFPLFEKKNVDFRGLVEMNENDLKEIGIKLFGPRRKITSAIKCWLENNVSEASVHELNCKVQDLSLSLTDAQIRTMK